MHIVTQWHLKICTIYLGIEALFPTETGSTYFIPYDKHSSRANKGKLYDKYCNIRKKIKNIALATQHSSVVETTFSFDSNEGNNQLPTNNKYTLINMYLSFNMQT